jgi:hypothetical protein
MTTNEATALAALGLALGLSAAVVLYLGRPMRRVLADLCGSDDRARYWAAFANVVTLLSPLLAVLIAREPVRADESPLLVVLDQTRWALAGLTGAVVAVGLGIAIFVGARGGATLRLDRDQVHDLQRLLDKVHEIRAREIVSRIEPPNGPRH